MWRGWGVCIEMCKKIPQHTQLAGTALGGSQDEGAWDLIRASQYWNETFHRTASRHCGVRGSVKILGEVNTDMMKAEHGPRFGHVVGLP